jgi:hypothetical protein
MHIEVAWKLNIKKIFGTKREGVREDWNSFHY